jgi:hypothetical protein
MNETEQLRIELQNARKDSEYYAGILNQIRIILDAATIPRDVLAEDDLMKSLSPVERVQRLANDTVVLHHLLQEVDDAVYWLLNLVHGVSKDGGPPLNSEWEAAYSAAKEAHDKVQETPADD